MALLDILRQAQRERRAGRPTIEPSQPAPGEHGAGGRRVAEALPYLRMSLEEFQARGALLEIRVPGLATTLLFVPTEDDVRRLTAEGVRRGRIWTSNELMQLLTLADWTSETVSTITLTKLEMDGDIVAVRYRT